MSEITLDMTFKMKRIRVAILILGSVLMSANVFSRQCWNRGCFDVIHSIADNYIEMEFEFFDYDFGPLRENGYLKECYIQCSSDNQIYFSLIKITTKDQAYDNWSWMLLSDKMYNAIIQFGRCYVPGAGKWWLDNSNYYRVEVYNSDGGKKAWFNFIWHLGVRFQEVKFVRLVGVWHVNGLYRNDIIDYVVFPINKFIISESKTPVSIDSLQKQVNTQLIDQPENNEIKISKHEDSIVIKGADPGQNIKVYTTSGALIKSVIANDDVVNIKLSTNQIYIVNIGHKRHRVAL